MTEGHVRDQADWQADWEARQAAYQREWEAKGHPEIDPWTEEPPAVRARPEPIPSILIRADALINGDRRRDYGHPLENFSRVAEYWSAYLTTRGGPPRPLTAEDVAHMMIMLKIARGAQGYNDDTYMDIAGYAGCVEAIHDAREESKRYEAT